MFSRLYYIILQRLYVRKNRNKPCQGKVYMFHDVSDKGDTYSINLDHFMEMLSYLSKHKKICDIDTLISEKDPDNVVLTFDDAYDSVYRHVYPLLKKLNVPFYVFICGEYLDAENYLNKKMIREMADDGKCIIGSHNMKHELSRFMAVEEFEQMIRESKDLLEDSFGYEVKDFAFPYGSIYACSDENIKAVAKEYAHVFMTYNLPYNEEYGNIIPRININDRTYKEEVR